MKNALSKTFFALTVLAFIACSKDKCKDVSCQNSGTCADGSCQCSDAYQGNNCEKKNFIKVLSNGSSKTWRFTKKVNSDGSEGQLSSSQQNNRITFYSNGRLTDNSIDDYWKASDESNLNLAGYSWTIKYWSTSKIELIVLSDTYTLEPI